MKGEKQLEVGDCGESDLIGYHEGGERQAQFVTFVELRNVHGGVTGLRLAM